MKSFGGAKSCCALLFALGCADDGGVEQPQPLTGEPPVEYPVQLWEQDVEGVVLLRVLVSEEGRADSVEVAESSGHAVLDSAAASGIQAMNFEPARRQADGAAEAVWVRVPVTFSKTPPTDSTLPPARTPSSASGNAPLGQTPSLDSGAERPPS